MLDLCRQLPQGGLILEDGCGGCAKGTRVAAGRVPLSSVVPQGLCATAFFSLAPYWLSYKEGAWFRWRENRDDVIVQCPRPKGVVFLVERREGEAGCEVTARVERVVEQCPMNHREGDLFTLEAPFCTALFPSLWNRLGASTQEPDRLMLLSCCKTGETLRCRRVP